MREHRPEPDKETVRIRRFQSPEEIRRFSFSDSFGDYAKYRSLYTKRESLEKLASREGTNVTLAVTREDRIVGFGVLEFPEDERRWEAVGEKVMMQVKALEVSRKMRARGIASALLENLLDYPGIAAKIVFLVAYSWTWDLEGAGESVHQYRNKLVALYTKFDFKEYPTNDPNVCLKPENLFMARIGTQVDSETKNAFKWACFGQTP